MKNRFGAGTLFGVASMIVLAAGIVSSQESGQATPRAAMRGVFVTVSDVYRISLDPDAFTDPGNRTEILSKLEALAGNTGQLEAHGGGLDPSYDFMRRSLASDADEALKEFKDRNDVGARFIVNNITENCFMCHTTIPSPGTFEPGHEFLKSVDTRNLPPAGLANLQVASRQFSDALKTYEGIILSPDETAEDLATFNVFEKYLRVCLGPVNDARRPVRTLEQFAGRADMPEELKKDARAWIASLKALNLDAPAGQDLAAARRLVTEGMKNSTSRSDVSHLVDFIASITLAHRYLRTQPQSAVDIAEAYYLLGVADSYVSHSNWVSQTEYLLAQSIRTAPRSDVAKQSLAYLEQYMREEPVDARARPVPPQLQTNIQELRKLVAQ